MLYFSCFSNVYRGYPPTMEPESKLINIKQAAKMLGVTPLTLRNWDKKGKLTAFRHPINNYRVYKLDDIQKLLEIIRTNTVPKPPRMKTKVVRKLSVQHL